MRRMAHVDATLGSKARRILGTEAFEKRVEACHSLELMYAVVGNRDSVKPTCHIRTMSIVDNI
jgi:hypothetical protein